MEASDTTPRIDDAPESATATAGIDPLSTDAPPEAKPGKPLEKGGQGKVVVRVAHPNDYFESGVKGVPTITSAGVEVDRSKVGALLEAAAGASISLEEVEE